MPIVAAYAATANDAQFDHSGYGHVVHGVDERNGQTK